MSIEALKKEIISSAEKEKERIISEAKAEAQKILEEANERALRIIERKRAQIESELRNKKEVAVAVKRLEGKRMVYEQIMKLLDEVREKSLEKIRDIKNSDEYIDIISKYIVEGLKDLNLVEAKVLYSSSDADFFKENSKKISEKVSKLFGKKVKLEFEDSGENFLGGVIVSDFDEKVFYVSTFDGRLNSLFEERLDEILNILRGGVE